MGEGILCSTLNNPKDVAHGGALIKVLHESVLERRAREQGSAMHFNRDVRRPNETYSILLQ
ncbi:MAG: hypothetical protein ACLGSH_07315 [Acidobacteriota bacterium]